MLIGSKSKKKFFLSLKTKNQTIQNKFCHSLKHSLNEKINEYLVSREYYTSGESESESENGSGNEGWCGDYSNILDYIDEKLSNFPENKYN